MHRIVYMPGVWDMLHVGHVRALERAAKYGDELIVGVPSDEVVKEDKGEYPIITAVQRAAMLASLRCVSRTEFYHTLDFIPHLQEFLPHVLAVGDTWGKDKRHKQAEEWCVWHNRELIKIKYSKDVSTTLIKARVVEQYLSQKEQS